MPRRGLVVAVLLTGVAAIAATPPPIAAPTETPLPAANLIRNGGFEEGPGAYQGVGRYWESNDARQHPEIALLDGEVKRSGAFSQKLAAHPQWDAGAVRQISDYNTVSGGKTYELRAWIKTEGIANPAGWYLIGIWWFCDDTWLGDIKNPPQSPLNHDWQEIVLRGVAPANANRAGVLLTRHTDGTVWYDDIVLYEVAP